jgi:glycosyltransferase involved in cell wall biosynthesis
VTSNVAELPRISIITPSWNQRGFIGATIDSVLGQGYPNLDYVIVDGDSTDGTLDILRGYGEAVRWMSEPDRGQAHALNKGLRMTTGDVIGFLNSDDVYEPGALLAVGRFFAGHPEAHWVTGRCRTIDERDNEIRRPITAYKNAWLQLRSYRALLLLNYMSQPATFWTRTAGEEVGDFDESLRYAMDYDYWLRLGRRHRLWLIDRYLASFRVHAASKAGAAAAPQFDSDMRIVRRYTSSRLVLAGHRAHNALAVAVYRLLLWYRDRRAARQASG